jgi:multiple sugar transport system permease protein
LRAVLGRNWLLGWLLIAPTAAIILALLAYPLVDAILLSFQDRLIGGEGSWVGFQNYVNFWTNPDSHFFSAVFATLGLTAGAIFCKLLLGLAMASVLNQDIPAKNLWRGLMFLPWAVPAVVTAYVWRFMFDATGPINGAIAQFHLLNDYILFFSDAKLALPALIGVVVWAGTPFWTMNILAGMQAISQDMYEAAEIDGAATFQRFRFVTLPSLQNVLLVTGLLSTIWTSANFVQIFVLTGGGPNYVTTTLPFLAYLVAIPGHQLGAGSAISMMMMPFYLVLVYFLTRRMLRQE